MSFVRSPLFISIVISAGLWALGVSLSLAPSGGRGAFSVIVCSNAVPDREIREHLEKEGFSGLISESGQKVLLDSFGSLEQIALDEYDSRVLPFDPRNDGYAEKLRSLFVDGDRRFIYIPRGLAAKQAGVEQRLASAMGDIPYVYFDEEALVARTGSRTARQTGLSLVLFCCAAAVFLIARPLRRAVQSHAACLIPCLPMLVPLVLAGAAGFILASLLSGLAALLAEPCFKRLTRSRVFYRQPPKLMPLPLSLSLSLLLLGYGGIAFFSGLPPVFTALAFALFGGIFAYSLWNAARSDPAASAADVMLGGLLSRRRKAERRRFSPVLILRPYVSAFAFSWAMIPFAAAALVAACISISASPAPASSPVLPSAAAFTEADYQAHYRFQSAFSEKSLHVQEAPGSMAERMNAYELAPDGLSVMPAAMPPIQEPPPAAPPFPLADLLRFLHGK